MYDAISLEIAQGLLPPGMPLDEVRIAERYRVSRTPLREAIRQLEMAGLVESRPHRGAVVKSISEKELDEMFSVMAELEAVSARWASASMTGSERQGLAALHQSSKELVQAGDRQRYAAFNSQFHAAIYEGAHNGYLLELTQGARRRVAPYRRAQFEDQRRLSLSFDEHGRIVAAIQRGDADAAYQAMRDHIVLVRVAVEQLTADSLPSRRGPRSDRSERKLSTKA